MRDKDEILSKVIENISKAPKDTRPMLYHEYCFVEVMLDIRDILREVHKELARPGRAKI